MGREWRSVDPGDGAAIPDVAEPDAVQRHLGRVPARPSPHPAGPRGPRLLRVRAPDESITGFPVPVALLPRILSFFFTSFFLSRLFFSFSCIFIHQATRQLTHSFCYSHLSSCDSDFLPNYVPRVYFIFLSSAIPRGRGEPVSETARVLIYLRALLFFRALISNVAGGG